jgi:hypothetical protein
MKQRHFNKSDDASLTVFWNRGRTILAEPETQYNPDPFTAPTGPVPILKKKQPSD